MMSFYQNAAYLLGVLTFAVIVMALQTGRPAIPVSISCGLGVPTPRICSMGLCGIIAAIGSTLPAHAYRVRGRRPSVTPFEYTGMIWGSLFGYLFFGAPRLTTFLGMGLIALAGTLALRAAKAPTASTIKMGQFTRFPLPPGGAC
ncbi:MAG: hypothetical protein U1E15_09605 [Hyphomicrobiales bacterium]